MEGTGACRSTFPQRPPRGAGPAECHGRGLQYERLEAAFHQDLAQPRLYPLTTVPGDWDPDRLIEILTPRGSGQEKNGWRELVRSAYGYAIPSRAFVVDATLRRRAAAPHYGVAVRIRHLPLSFVELETVWSTDPERALQRAAYSICAFVLPHTRACRSAPWRDWQSKRIPPQLFRSYHRAKRMIQERRYDEALQLYHDAVKADSDNVVMRYEMGQLFERLRLYADALDLYCELMREVFPAESRSGRSAEEPAAITPFRPATHAHAAANRDVVIRSRLNRARQRDHLHGCRISSHWRAPMASSTCQRLAASAVLMCPGCAPESAGTTRSCIAGSDPASVPPCGRLVVVWQAAWQPARGVWRRKTGPELRLAVGPEAPVGAEASGCLYPLQARRSGGVDDSRPEEGVTVGAAVAAFAVVAGVDRLPVRRAGERDGRAFQCRCDGAG
jgi:hypothetical protein